MRDAWWKFVWYELLYYPAVLLAVFLLSLRVLGRRLTPKRGGLLIIANHQSYLDPPLIGIAVRRHLSYVAKKPLFKSRLFAWFIDSLGAVPIDQEASGVEGIKTSLNLLKAGKAVVIFPEGSRTPDGQIKPFKPGIVVLIRRAGVPVLPVGIAGAYEAWPMHRKLPRLLPLVSPWHPEGISVVIGRPIPAQKLKHLEPQAIVARLYDVIADLRARAERLRRHGG
jgi:1-acyl-sn-glycerol-3-phosphate acyltransferase